MRNLTPLLVALLAIPMFAASSTAEPLPVEPEDLIPTCDLFRHGFETYDEYMGLTSVGFDSVGDCVYIAIRQFIDQTSPETYQYYVVWVYPIHECIVGPCDE